MGSDILVVGAGPVGLTLACELARHGVRPRIIDKLDTPSPYCRAIGVTSRTLEVMEDMGVVRELIDAGLWLTGMRMILPGGEVKDLTLDLSDLPFAMLGVPQNATEAVLTAHLGTFGIEVERGVALAGLAQDTDGIDVELDTPDGRRRERFRYVVGCDGAHSAVRRALGIGFQGDAFLMEFMLGDVHVDWGEADLPRGMTLRAIRPIDNAPPDLLVAVPLTERGRYRVSAVAPARFAAADGEGTDHGIQADRPGASLDDLQEVADRLLPTPATLSDLRWSSIFRISMRLADKYRIGNAFIAGDACHIHPPTGGQGMNTGIQDAYNLAWKLALVAQSRAADALLDSYEAERRPVAEEVIRVTTEASINLGRKGPPDRLADTQVLLSYAGGPLSAGEGNGRLRPGDRVPDVPNLTRLGLGFPLRLFELLRGTRHVLLMARTDGDNPDTQSWKAEACANTLQAMFPDLVRIVVIAPADAPAEQPPGVELVHEAGGAFRAAFGEGALWLVRPDGYLGLVGDSFSECAVVRYLRDVVGLRAS